LMDTKRFPVLIEVFKRNNNTEPDIVKMQTSTMVDFAISALGVDTNIVSHVPTRWMEFIGFIRRRQPPPLIAKTIYGLRVVIDESVPPGEVQLLKEGMPQC